MWKSIPAAVILCGLMALPLAAQTKKPVVTTTTYDLTVNADGQAHTGTMTLEVAAGRVDGDMRITSPGEITGKPAGVLKGGVLDLAFTYRMVQRGCDGNIKMNIKMPAKRGGSANGTAEILGCGRTEANKLAGKVELKPQPAKK